MATNFLKKYASKIYYSQKKKEQSPFKKLTHLRLNGKEIEEIGDLRDCSNLVVLYLHNNMLTEIGGLESLKNLTHLYLQWNKISKMSNLNCLRKLKKLYLSYNEIERLENVEQLTNLEELHLDGQRISVEFSFDKPSLRALSQSLMILNVSKLNLTKIDALQSLIGLEVLDASENKFKNPEDIASVIGHMPFLRKLDFHGCPAQNDIHYREIITAGANKLEYLDEKYITGSNRAFIKKFHQIRLERQLRNDLSKMEVKSKTDTFASSISKKPSVYLLSNMADELSFRPWNSLHSIQRPRRFSRKHVAIVKPKADYQLQGKNISN